MRQPVRIVGRALLTPLGVGLDRFAASLTANEPARGRIPEFRLGDFVRSVKTYVDRTSALALAACAVALKEAGWENRATAPEVGLALGTQWGCLDSLKLFYDKTCSAGPRLAPPLIFPHAYTNAPVSLASIEFDLRGPSLCISSGAVSGALALACALDTVRLGHTSRMLAGGVDSLSPVLSDESADALSEAAAILAIEHGSSTASCYGTIIEWAAANDTDSVLAARRALRTCLDAAEVPSTDITRIICCSKTLETFDLERSPEWDDKKTLLLSNIAGDLMSAAPVVGVMLATICPDGRLAAVICADPGGSAAAFLVSA